MVAKKPKRDQRQFRKMNIPLPIEVYEALKERADSENRSMTGQLLWMLRKDLGLIKSDEGDT